MTWIARRLGAEVGIDPQQRGQADHERLRSDLHEGLHVGGFFCLNNALNHLEIDVFDLVVYENGHPVGELIVKRLHRRSAAGDVKVGLVERLQFRLHARIAEKERVADKRVAGRLVAGKQRDCPRPQGSLPG